MFCPTCSKLAIIDISNGKKCARCQGALNKSVAIICESCSTKNGICCGCLKRLVSKPRTLAGVGGCSSCRKGK